VKSRTTRAAGNQYSELQYDGGSRPIGGRRNNLKNKRDLQTDRSIPEHSTGQVRFDDRGNAVWQTEPGRRLEHSTLSLADDQPERDGHRTNYNGLRTGYNPYDSGVLSKDGQRRKKDLRALSNWIERQRRRED
jgi:hypothetical protein